jgi:hypothetical protein
MEARMAKDKSPISAAEVVVCVGLLCLTVGAWHLIGWASLIAPGLILIFYGLPPRPPFVHRSQDRR